jgi:hypothetical protein
MLQGAATRNASSIAPTKWNLGQSGRLRFSAPAFAEFAIARWMNDATLQLADLDFASSGSISKPR